MALLFAFGGLCSHKVRRLPAPPSMCPADAHYLEASCSGCEGGSEDPESPWMLPESPSCAQGHSWCAIRRETGIAQGAAPRAFYGLPKSLVASTSLILRKWPRRLSQAGLLRMPRGRPNGVRDGKPTLNEAARAADAARDTIWQGNCDLADLRLRNNIAPIRNTIPIQYPISNCPAKKRLPSSRCIESAPGRGSAIPQLCAVGALPIQH